MSDLVGNQNCWFSHAKVHMGKMTKLSWIHAVWLFLNYDLLDFPKLSILIPTTSISQALFIYPSIIDLC